MYNLQLADGSIIPNLMRINVATFWRASTDPQLYNRLSDDNLAFAFLYKDGEDPLLGEVLIDYALQNYCQSPDGTRFRLQAERGTQGGKT